MHDAERNVISPERRVANLLEEVCDQVQGDIDEVRIWNRARGPVEIAAEKNSTTIFPIPIDTIAPFLKHMGKPAEPS